MNANRAALQAALEVSEEQGRFIAAQAEEINRLFALNEDLQRQLHHMKKDIQRMQIAEIRLFQIKELVNSDKRNGEIMKQIVELSKMPQPEPTRHAESIAEQAEPENQASMPAPYWTPSAKPSLREQFDKLIKENRDLKVELRSLHQNRAQVTDPLRDGERLAHPATASRNIDPEKSPQRDHG